MKCQQNLTNVKFHRAQLQGANLTSCVLMGTEFDCADLTDANLKAEFDKEGPKHLAEARFSKAVLTRVDFSYLKTLRGIVFAGADLRGCDFRYSNLQNARFEEADLRKAKFHKAMLTDCDFFQCDLDDALMVDATLDEASLIGSKLFRTDLRGASLKKCRYGESSFREAILYDVDFTDAHLGQKTATEPNEPADFVKAKFDRRTILPDGVNWSESISESELSEKFGMLTTEKAKEKESEQEMVTFDENSLSGSDLPSLMGDTR